MEPLPRRMGLAVVAVSCLLSLARLPTAEAYNSVQDYKFVAGGCGFALNFDGGRSDMASLVFPKKLTEFTVEMWVKLRNPFQPENSVLVYSAYDSSTTPPISSPTEFALTFNTEENRVYTINRYNYQYCSTARCKVQFGALDRWQHVSYVWKGYELVVDGVDGIYNDFLLYNNGDPIYDLRRQEADHRELIAYGELVIGQRATTFQKGYNEYRAFSGLIDELRIWDKAQTGVDIRAFYARELNPALYPRLQYYFNFDEPDDGWGYNRDGWECCIPVTKNLGRIKGSDLEIGRTADLTNLLTFETERGSVLPTQPRFVFSDVPMAAFGSVSMMQDARLEDTYIALEFRCLYEDFDQSAITTWLLVGFDAAGNTEFNPVVPVSNPGGSPSGYVYQIGGDGLKSDQVFFNPALEGWGVLITDTYDGVQRAVTRPAVKVSNISKYGDPTLATWCGAPYGECPYGIIYAPTDAVWSEAGYVQDQVRFIAYAPSSRQYADYRIWGESTGDRATYPATVNVWEEKRDGASGPQNFPVLVQEDRIAYVDHGGANDFGFMRTCVLRTLPANGKVYELQFKEDLPHVYNNIEDDISKLTVIDKVPFQINNTMCTLLYMPPTDAFGPGVDTWTYAYTYSDGSRSTQQGTVTINVNPVNDPPNSNHTRAKTLICDEFIDSADFCVVRMTAEDRDFVSIKLNSSDVDGSPVQNGGSRNYRDFYTIHDMPLLGSLRQQVSPYRDTMMGPPINMEPVLTAMGFASDLLSGSSQRTRCNVAASKCDQPDFCNQYEFEYCAYEEYHLTNILGENNDLVPLDETAFFSLEDINPMGTADVSNEYIEVAVHPGDGTSFLLDRITIYEASNPGAVVKVWGAKEYLGRNNGTKWRLIAAYDTDPSAAALYPNGRAWEPTVCRIPQEFAYYRIEVARWTGQSGLASNPTKTGAKMQPMSYDAVKFEGSTAPTGGMVTYEEFDNTRVLLTLKDWGRVIYIPPRGYHAEGVFDIFSYDSSDCDAVAEEPMEIAVMMEGPMRPIDYCDPDVWLMGANNASCIEQWMDYAKDFGHAGAGLSGFVQMHNDPLSVIQTFFVQPNTTAMVEVPVARVTRELFAKYGVTEENICEEDPVVYAYLAGASGRTESTAMYSVAERSTGEVYAKLNEPLIPNGRTEDAELRDRVGYDCLDYYGYALGGNAYFDFNTKFHYAVTTVYEEQLETPLYIDTWVVMQPTRTTPSYYYPRVRQQIVQMCTMNFTHVQYYYHTEDPSTSYGMYELRQSYNASGKCDDCFCSGTCKDFSSEPRYVNEYNLCTPCHRLSQSHIDKIMSDPYEEVHFREVCAILFEQCDAGRFFDADTFYRTGSLELACKACPPGRFNPRSNKLPECELCPAGTYYPDYGATKCISCRGFVMPGYSSYMGATACTPCPRDCLRASTTGECQVYDSFTVELNRTNELAGMYMSDCVCKPGYFHREKRVGQVCEECPEGGYCAGGLESPVPCGPLVYDNEGLNELSADWDWQCIKEDGGYWAGEGESLFFMCEGEHCLGGIKSECQIGHTSRLCAQCDTGYFSIAAEELGCIKCPGGHGSALSWFATLFGIVGVFCAWYALGVLVCGAYDSLDILLMYTQVIAVIHDFQVAWTTSGSGFLAGAHKAVHMGFNLLNLDVDFFLPTCIMYWDYEYSFYLQMFFPVLMASAAFGYYLWALFCTNVLQQKVPSAWRSTRWWKWFEANLDSSTDEANLRRMLDGSMSSFLQFAVMNYNILCSKSFEVFVCEEQESGEQFLVAGPEITCWTPRHYGMLFTGCVSLFINVIGIPVVLFTLVKWAENHDTLNQRRFLQAFGWVYMRYEMDYNTWEGVLLARRFFMALVAVFLYNTPYVQISMGIIVISCMSGGHFFARPFRSTALDLMDSLALLQTIFYLVCAVLLHSTPRFVENEYYSLIGANTLSVMMLISVMVVLAVGSTLSTAEVFDLGDREKAGKLVSERLVEALEGVGLAYQILGTKGNAGDAQAGFLTMDMFRQRLLSVDPELTDKTITLLYKHIDEDESGTVDVNEFRNKLWARRRVAMKRLEREELGIIKWFAAHLKDAVQGRLDDLKLALFRFTDTLEDYVDEQGRESRLPQMLLRDLRGKFTARMAQQVGKLDIALCGNLNEIFKGYHVLNFIETTISDKSIIRYHQVDQWMSVAIADESEIGQFAANHLVDFFRPLLAAWPFTLDWLTTASEADRFHFRKVMESMFHCYEVVGKDGQYAPYVIEGHRPSVSIFLKDCTEEQQVVFWEMMHSLVACNVTTEEELDRVEMLAPYSMGAHGDEEPGVKSSTEDSTTRLRVQREGRHGIAFEFDDDENVVRATMPAAGSKQDAGAGMDFKEVSIVGEPKVGKLLVASGDMPARVERCKFQWFRVRTRASDGQVLMEKIAKVNMPHYTVTRNDIGCQLRMVVRPYFADGTAGKVATAITETAVVDFDQ